MSASAKSNTPQRTMLLTGASRGIGHATVKRFSSAGWRVITCSRHPFPEDCPWEMGPEDHLQLDLGDPDDIEAAIGEVKQRLPEKRLDALVNNAGISPKAQDGVRLGTIETAIPDWKTVFQVNFFAPVMLARGLIHELQNAHGSVVNVTSIAGSRVHPFAGAAYATSKAALAALTREMAADFGPSTSCRCGGSARPRKSPRRSTFCAPNNRATCTGRRFTSTAGSTFEHG